MEYLNENIPDSSVRRLSAYLRQLEQLSRQGVERVSSQDLAEYMKVGAAQVRRDLALFGQFGRRGYGYEVGDLIFRLRSILGTQSPWSVVIVGAGEISHALLRYRGFGERGFRVVAAFDNDPKKIGRHVGKVVVQPLEELEGVIEREGVRLAILTVPDAAAQDVANRLGRAGIEGVLNFASVGLEPPPGVFINQVDITAHLEQLTFQVSNYRP